MTVAERLAGDFITQFTCKGCGFEQYGWYSDIYVAHAAAHPESHDVEQVDAMCAFCHRLTSEPYETPDGDVICDDCAEPEPHVSEGPDHD